MRLCTAEVHEAHRPRKLGRGVELRRIEVAMMVIMMMVMMMMMMTMMRRRSVWI